MKFFLPILPIAFLSFSTLVPIIHATDEAEAVGYGSGYNDSPHYRPSGSYGFKPGYNDNNGYGKGTTIGYGKQCCTFSNIEGTLNCLRTGTGGKMGTYQVCTLDIDDDDNDSHEMPYDCFDWDEGANYVTRISTNDDGGAFITTWELQGGKWGNVQLVGTIRGEDREGELGVVGGLEECSVGATGQVTVDLGTVICGGASGTACRAGAVTEFEVRLDGKICCDGHIY